MLCRGGHAGEHTTKQIGTVLIDFFLVPSTPSPPYASPSPPPSPSYIPSFPHPDSLGSSRRSSRTDTSCSSASAA